MSEHSDSGELISLGDIPETVREDIKETIENFTVGILGVDRQQGRFSFLGSGTLVYARGSRYVLTATHVWEKVRRFPRLGLAIAEFVHAWSIPLSVVEARTVGTRKSKEWGPDLTFLCIPPAYRGTLEAHRVFYRMDTRRERALSKLPTINVGAWVLAGCPAEGSDPEPPVAGLEGKIGFTTVEKTHVRKPYDYLDLGVSYVDDGSWAPSTFGGMSGGGLWHCPIRRDSATGEIRWTDSYFLEGVIFYESEIAGDRRFIRCHSRRTLYEAGLDALA